VAVLVWCGVAVTATSHITLTVARGHSSARRLVGGDDGKEADPEHGMSVNEVNRTRKLKSVLLTLMEGTDFPFVQKQERTALRRALAENGRRMTDWAKQGWFQGNSTVTVTLSFLTLMVSTYPGAQKAAEGFTDVSKWYVCCCTTCDATGLAGCCESPRAAGPLCRLSAPTTVRFEARVRPPPC
jgi:hypothetical protein